MANELTTTQSCANVAKILENLPALIVSEGFVEAAAAFNEVIYDALLEVTPVQNEEKTGGYFREPGSLRYSLDSGVELDRSIQGVRAGVGYGNQAWIAALVEYGHQASGAIKGRTDPIPPHPFMRSVVDGNAPERAIIAFAEVIANKLPMIAARVNNGK